MAITKALWDEIYNALETVTACLSKVPDSTEDWNQVYDIQAKVNECQELVSQRERA